MTLDRGGSWSDHLKEAVDLVNEAVNQITGFSPKDLWEADLETRKLAQSRSEIFRRKKNEKRRYSPKKFFPGQTVLAYDAVAASSREDKFLPHWKGPYELQYKIAKSMWKGEGNWDRKRGRTPSYFSIPSRSFATLGYGVKRETMGMFEVCAVERWCAHVKVADV